MQNYAPLIPIGNKGAFCLAFPLSKDDELWFFTTPQPNLRFVSSPYTGKPIDGASTVEGLLFKNST